MHHSVLKNVALLVVAVMTFAAIDARADGAWAPAEGASLVGTRAPAWEGLRWIHGGPLTLAGLRGHPVLVRFWTDGCHFCASSAPALLEVHKKFAARGLVVVGVHHPKSDESHDAALIERAAQKLGFTFPIATDDEWKTVRAYGVGRVFNQFTSVSVLIDADGVIRWVHDGGTLDLASPAYRALTAEITRELAPR